MNELDVIIAGFMLAFLIWFIADGPRQAKKMMTKAEKIHISFNANGHASVFTQWPLSPEDAEAATAIVQPWIEVNLLTDTPEERQQVRANMKDAGLLDGLSATEEAAVIVNFMGLIK